jgi:ferrous iron transport protein B
MRSLKSAINRPPEEKRISPVRGPSRPRSKRPSTRWCPQIRERLGRKDGPRWGAVKLLEGDPWVSREGERAKNPAGATCKEIEEKLGEEADILVADSRYGLIGIADPKDRQAGTASAVPFGQDRPHRAQPDSSASPSFWPPCI